MLPRGAAQAVTGTFYWPTAPCVKALAAEDAAETDCFIADNSLWLSQRALRQALEPQGVVFSQDLSLSEQPILKLTFPDSTPVYVGTEKSQIFFSGSEDVHTAPVPDYLSLWSVLKAASYQKDVRLVVEGWDNPTVHFNTASLTIGTSERPMGGFDFYENYLDKALFGGLIGTAGGEYIDLVLPQRQGEYRLPFADADLKRVSLPVPGGAPGVYGLITRLEVGGRYANTVAPGDTLPNASFMLNIARTDAQGNITFEVPKAPLRFVDAFLAEDPEGASVLVSLGGGAATGGGWYEVIRPAGTSQTRN